MHATPPIERNVRKTNKIMAVYSHNMIGSWASSTATLVAAIMPTIPKNIMYNSLDIVAKNFYGLFIFYEVIKLKK